MELLKTDNIPLEIMNEMLKNSKFLHPIDQIIEYDPKKVNFRYIKFLTKSL